MKKLLKLNQIAEKVIAKNLSAEDQKDLVDQFIKGLDD